MASSIPPPPYADYVGGDAALHVWEHTCVPFLERKFSDELVQKAKARFLTACTDPSFSDDYATRKEKIPDCNDKLLDLGRAMTLAAIGTLNFELPRDHAKQFTLPTDAHINRVAIEDGMSVLLVACGPISFVNHCHLVRLMYSLVAATWYAEQIVNNVSMREFTRRYFEGSGVFARSMICWRKKDAEHDAISTDGPTSKLATIAEELRSNVEYEIKIHETCGWSESSISVSMDRTCFCTMMFSCDGNSVDVAHFKNSVAEAALQSKKFKDFMTRKRQFAPEVDVVVEK